MKMHKCLRDFVTLLADHEAVLKRLSGTRGRMNHEQLLCELILSHKRSAARFTFVIGSMKGSYDDLYDQLLERLDKKGRKDVRRLLVARRTKPCIDLQQCLFLVNQSSDRNKANAYGYRDYNEFRKYEFVTGTARAFSLNWPLLHRSLESGGPASGTGRKRPTRPAARRQAVARSRTDEPPSGSKDEARAQPTIPENDEPPRSAVLDTQSAMIESLDLTVLRKMIERFSPDVTVKPDGWWQEASSNELWSVFLMTILGSGLGADMRMTKQGEMMQQFSLERLSRMNVRGDESGIASSLEAELMAAGIPVDRRKVLMIAKALRNPRITETQRRSRILEWLMLIWARLLPAQGEGLGKCRTRFILLDSIRSFWRTDLDCAAQVSNDMRARDAIVKIVHGCNNRIAGIWLLEVGFARSMLVVDEQVIAVLNRLGLDRLDNAAAQSNPKTVQEVIEMLTCDVSPRLGVTVRVLDCIMRVNGARVIEWLNDHS